MAGTNRRAELVMKVINAIFALMGLFGLIMMGYGFYFIVDVLRPILQDMHELIRFGIGIGLIIAGYIISYISALWLKIQRGGEREG